MATTASARDRAAATVVGAQPASVHRAPGAARAAPAARSPAIATGFTLLNLHNVDLRVAIVSEPVGGRWCWGIVAPRWRPGVRALSAESIA